MLLCVVFRGLRTPARGELRFFEYSICGAMSLVEQRGDEIGQTVKLAQQAHGKS
jgi:hypothetical protein